MMKVLLLTRYERLGASSRVRFLQFLPRLKQAGFSFDVRPLLDNAYVQSLYGGPPVGRWSIVRAYVRRLRALFAARRYDLVWLEKEALPYLPAFIERTLLAGVPYVADYDDAWFHRYDMSQSRLVRALVGRKIDAVMRRAAIVVAGNDYLAARARQAGAERIVIIPSVIDVSRYREPPTARPGRDGKTVVGWIGIPLNAHYLTLIAPALRRVSDDITLHVVGGPVPSELAGVPAESFAWTEADEIERIEAFDVGIMPLADTPWERGKCAYKLLQVMASGKPVVASPVGANRQVVRHGENGFLADDTDEWADVLRTLSRDPALRAQLGIAARQSIAEGYSVEAVLPRLVSVLKEAASVRRR